MTFTQFITGLAAISVTGVKRTTASPPATIAPADMPLMYPRLPNGEAGNVSLGYRAGLTGMVCELVIVLEPARTNTNPANMTTALTLMDTLHTAIKTNMSALSIDRWSIAVQVDALGEAYYWLLVARIESSS